MTSSSITLRSHTTSSRFPTFPFLQQSNSMSSSKDSEVSISCDGLTRSLIRHCAPSIVITEELICNYCEELLKTGGVGKKLSCGHIFHPACILRSLVRNRSCPTCGWDLTATAPQDRSDDLNAAEASLKVVINSEEADEEPCGRISFLLRRLANTEIPQVMLCVVCQKNLKPGDVGKKLPCDHILHSHCVGHLYQKSREECPLCRHEI